MAKLGVELYGMPAEVTSRVRHGGFLASAELFDPAFFAISPAEAASMDPQQRLLLEQAYAVLHAAGMPRAILLGSTMAVNVGQWESEFASVLSATQAGRSAYAATAFATAVTCGRVSFVLDLHGPCATFNTACSSSLVAQHSSNCALQRFECEGALSAGVNMMFSAHAMTGNAVAGFTSITGRSHTFDVRADGYGRSEAITAVQCRMPAQAGNAVVAEWCGSAVRQDGRSASLTAPSGRAQQEVLAAALADAKLSAAQTPVLEAHGTGTALGDPIEAGALATVYLLPRTSADAPCTIGSAKANLGHTEPGAGLTGASKLLIQLQLADVSPNAQLRSLNPHVNSAMHGHAPCAMVV